MSITLNRDGYKQVIEDDIDFLNRHFPKELQNHPSYFHITSVLEHSIEYLYGKEQS